MSTSTTTPLDLSSYLPLVASGKVRELYTIDPNTLLFVASDRISAYDVILTTPIPGKGKLLTLLSVHWFGVLSTALPNLKHHFLTLNIPSSIPESLHPALTGRSMQVRKLRILPIEAIVRGYITGSAWSEYTKKGTVNGEKVDGKDGKALQESEQFPTPRYTPSTKAEAGQHDEAISVAEAARLIGDEKVAARVAELSVQLYTVARDYAAERGIIIADTKFEFGVEEGEDGQMGDVVLVDEVLTPDSSRFWSKEKYAMGKGQESFDKQYLRNWLTKEGKKGVEGVGLTDDVVKKTAEKYREAYAILTGKQLD